jgi:signal transduction protein with GAF and PtsI domain
MKDPRAKQIEELKFNLKKSNEDSKQKSLLLTLMDQVNKTLPELLIRSNDVFYNNSYGMRIINMLVTQIPLLMKSTKDINHRCAVFIKDPDDPEQLKIFEGCGYSIEGKENLRLKINNSIAGLVYKRGEYKYIKDVLKDPRFTPHPKATKKYHTLLCVPIIIRNETYAVLSIDGSKKNCFSRDDIDYFQMFANQLSIILDIMGITKVDKGGNSNEGKVKITG